MEEYKEYDMTGLATLVAEGETTPEELLDAALSRLAEVNPRINAVVILAEQTARRNIARGLPDGSFRGVPFLLKDLGCEAVDFPTHEGSHLMANTHHVRDSELYRRLAATGLVTFGRTATPENGIGIATEAAVYGDPTRNPWNPDHTPGGSSGGSGAAVAAGIVPGAQGSDGGGSVRIPASCCGLFGFKPTRARLPDGPYSGEGWGGMAIEGFLTRSVRDTAALLDATQGADLGAPYVAPPLEAGFGAATVQQTGPLRVALCDTSLSGAALDPACRDAVHAAARLLEGMGHMIEPARPEADHEDMIRGWCDIIACGTALSVRKELERLGRDLQPGDVEGVTRGAIAHAATISGEMYLDAIGRIHRFGREIAAFFEDWDILLTPTLAEPPARIGRFNHETEDFLHFRLGPGMCFDYSPFTAAFNATGQPAMSVPLAWSDDGLPIGIHFAARFGKDELLMSLAADLERAQPWFDRKPPGLFSW